MATNYQNTPYQGQQMPMQVGENTAYFQCNLASLASSFTGFVINDTVNLVQIPNFSILDDFYIDLCSLDTGAAVVESLGDNVSNTNGGAGTGGFATGMTLGRNASGTYRPGGTGFVHNAIPWVYGVPYANVPTVGIWLRLAITTAPTTPTTTGIIGGWVKYHLLTSTEVPSGSGGKPAL